MVTTMSTDQGIAVDSTSFALIIHEYAGGLQKPFTLIANSNVFFGVCQYFSSHKVT